ncbi:MAG: PDDEXK nuclease domain-containing protein [Deltaproteobacteria bacterium]|nr:PDDEXK nuclease domain-containing protein [Deltaproteobacteria bacterium]
MPTGYTSLIGDLKKRIQQSRLRVAASVNQELLFLYYSMGFDLDRRLQEEEWGSGIIDRVSVDLRAAFPEMNGLSPRNLRRMRAFYRLYRPRVGEVRPRDVAKLLMPKWPRAVAKLPWAHNVILMEKLKDIKTRSWYAAAALEFGWSRDVLALQIDGQAHQRHGKAITNFNRTLPPPLSDLAQQVTRDPYQFGFLSLAQSFIEREVERQLVGNVKDLLLELGKGFAFVGSQVPLRVSDKDYYLDLLFYHIKLHCYVVIELKEGKFKPEHAGKLNFYLSAVDDLLRESEDKPTIGLLLCRSKRHFDVEYALRDLNKPIGVASWKTQIVSKLPQHLKSSLPTVEEIEAELAGDLATPKAKKKIKRRVHRQANS